MIEMLVELFKEINESGLQYVHWKSNEHIDASFNGDTDFDILVSSSSLKSFVHIIENHGFTLFESVANQSYNGVFDYIFVNDTPQKIIHIHLHSVLITGAKFVKEYRLPLEDFILNNRLLDDTQSIFVIKPSTELALLWVRFFSKTSPLKFVLKRGRIGRGFVTESNWLIQKCEAKEVYDSLKYIFPNDDALADELSKFPFNLGKKRNMLGLLKRTRKALEIYRVESNPIIKYYCRRLGMMRRYFLQKYLRLPVPYRRVQLSGGKIVAVVGCDGAGKSTINHNLLKLLRSKIDVYFQYFGSGDGYCYWYRYPLLIIHKMMQHGKKSSSGQQFDINKHISLSKAVWAVLLAKEKESKLKRVNAARAKGMLVLCDRYPQTQYLGINDGPLLYGWKNSSNPLKRKISNWEYKIYKSAETIFPDLTIKLMIDEETSVVRKPEEKIERIRQKIALMNDLEIPSRNNVVIDATQPLEKVLQNVYRHVSELISDK